MGRLDLPDKPVDWVAVSREYLGELYDEIEKLRARIAELELRRAA
jgi:hypothetical protein